MASLVYTPAKTGLASGAINLTTADVRVLLVMTNTTADTDQDVANIGDFGTLDEYDGANYARKTLTGEAVNEDAANNRAEFDHNDVTWTALGAGTRQAAGMVYYIHVTNDADAILLAYVDTGGFPFAGNGGDVVLAVNAEGAIQVASMAEPFVTYVAITSPGASTGSGTATPAWPTHTTDDIGILVVNTQGGQAIATPSGDGWAQIGSNQSSGTGILSAGVQIFWKRATSGSMGNASIPYTSQDHMLLRLLTFRGAIATGDPFEGAAGGDSADGAVTGPTLGTVATTGDFRLIIDAIATGNNSSAARASAWDNPDTYVRTERNDDGTTAGTGGGLSINAAQTRKVGTLAGTTVTITSAKAAWVSFAFIPASLTPEFSGPYPTIDDTVTSSQTAAATGQVITLPYRSLGQLMVIAMEVSPTTVTGTLTGWTDITDTPNSTNTRLRIWYRIADGSETPTVTLTTSGNARTEMIAWSVSGYAPGSVPVVGTAATGSSTTPDAPNLSPSWGAGHTLWLAVAGTDRTTFSSYPTNYTLGQANVLNGNANGNNIMGAGRQLFAASENPGGFTITTIAWVAQTIAIQARPFPFQPSRRVYAQLQPQ